MDNWARAFGIAGIVLGIGSLLLTWLPYKSSISEEMVVTVDGRPSNNFIDLTLKESPAALLAYVTIDGRVVVSNTGNRPLSIVSYRIGNAPDTVGPVLDGKLLDEHEPVQMPLPALQPGESREYEMRVSILVNRDVYQALANVRVQYPDAGRRELLGELEKQEGLDLLGNKLKAQEYPGGAFSVQYESDTPKSTTVFVEFKTGMDETFSGRTTWGTL